MSLDRLAGSLKSVRNSSLPQNRSSILALMTITRPSLKRWSAVVLFAGIVLLAGCSSIFRLYQGWYVSRFDGDIRSASAAAAAARSDAQRSAAYADRADAYAEKARYSRVMKLIPSEEYSKLFDLAVQDYNQAIALAPDNSDIYYRRGNAYYSRADLDMIYQPRTSVFFAPAKTDFSRVVEKDPTNVLALDMLGLTDGSMGDWTQAIAVFKQEAALKPNMRFRISDAYCNRGSRYPKENYDLAISDLKQAIEMRGASDACECEPYNPLLAIYLYQTQYDKAREIVALAQSSKKWIAPEYLERLKASSAADDH